MKKEESSGDTIPESENIVEWRGHMEEFQIIDNCLMVKLPQEIDHHRAGFISEKADHQIPIRLLSDMKLLCYSYPHNRSKPALFPDSP